MDVNLELDQDSEIPVYNDKFVQENGVQDFFVPTVSPGMIYDPPQVFLGRTKVIPECGDSNITYSTL